MKRLRPSVGAAAAAYRRWHQREPHEVVELDAPLEDFEVARGGYADSILYVSDKWDDGIWDYLHDFDSKPSVFLCDGTEEPGDLCDLLNMPNISRSTELPMPVLAGVKELIFVRDDGSKRSLRFRSPPMMCCTTDMKCLVILSEGMGPIYVRGGRMFVDERGIHH